MLVLSGDAGSLLAWAVDAVISLLALLVTLLVQKHKKLTRQSDKYSRCAVHQVIELKLLCCTGANAQILTLRGASGYRSRC
jgi:hypothetical protein